MTTDGSVVIIAVGSGAISIEVNSAGAEEEEAGRPEHPNNVSAISAEVSKIKNDLRDNLFDICKSWCIDMVSYSHGSIMGRTYRSSERALLLAAERIANASKYIISQISSPLSVGVKDFKVVGNILRGCRPQFIIGKQWVYTLHTKVSFSN
jgi:hypothetical protein